MTNILTDLVPAKVRLWLYLGVFLVLLAFGAFQAAEGNVLEAVVGFLTALAPLLAGSNLNKPAEPPQLMTNPYPINPSVTTNAAPTTTTSNTSDVKWDPTVGYTFPTQREQ